MVTGTQPKLPGLGRATAPSTLEGDPQRPHSEENQLMETRSLVCCGNIPTDCPADSWARGATSQWSGRAGQTGVGGVCRGQMGGGGLTRKCVWHKSHQKPGGIGHGT